MEENVSILFYRKPDGSLEKIPFLARIPQDQLKNINLEIENLIKDLKENNRNMIEMKQENDIRKDASVCKECDLCIVCGGTHRIYSKKKESWPPGHEECCFAYKNKKGKPIKDEPCKLCELHDKELRIYHRLRHQGLSSKSSLNNKLRSAIISRRRLFETHKIECEVMSE